MRKILVITHFLPWPVRQGSWRRNRGLLEHLQSQGHRVDLFVASQRPWAQSLVDAFPPVVDRVIMCPPSGRGGRQARLIGHTANVIRALRLPLLEKLGRSTLEAARCLLNSAHRVFKQGPIIATHNGTRQRRRSGPGLFFTGKQKDQIRNLLAQGDYDTILVGNTTVTPLLSGVPRDGRLWLVDTNDCFYRRAQSMLQQGIEVPDHLNYTRQEERDALAGFDVIIAIQEEEAKLFREMLPEKQTIHVGMAGSLQQLPDRRGHVTILGANSPINAEGTVRVLREVWPSVMKKHPEAVLDIYGGMCDCNVVKHEAARFGRCVVLHGMIDDLKQAYHCDAVLAPLWAGSGLKTKVVEALCHGKPVVTTSIGAQGLARAVGSAILAADQADGLIEHLSLLISDDRRRRAMADASYAFASEHLIARKVYAELDKVLAEKSPAQTVDKPKINVLVA